MTGPGGRGVDEEYGERPPDRSNGKANPISSDTNNLQDPSVDRQRPFGAHLAMRWWVPALLTVVVVAATYLLQVVLGLAAAVVEIRLLGKDPQDETLTPLTYLATNLAIIGIVPLVVLVMAKAAKVHWRSLLTVSRVFSWRRLFSYLGIFTLLMVVVNLAVQFVNPSPLSAFAITGTTVGLLAVVALTTPFQAAAEEITFRGALTTAYGSWFRAARPAVIAGIVLSSLLFALLHTTADPWMFINYLGLAGGTAVMALISRGLEPAIAFHVMNNVFAMGIGALFSSGGGIGQDRSAGAAGPYMLLFVLAEIIGILIVWRIERRRESRRTSVR